MQTPELRAPGPQDSDFPTTQNKGSVLSICTRAYHCWGWADLGTSRQGRGGFLPAGCKPQAWLCTHLSLRAMSRLRVARLRPLELLLPLLPLLLGTRPHGEQLREWLSRGHRRTSGTGRQQDIAGRKGTGTPSAPSMCQVLRSGTARPRYRRMDSSTARQVLVPGTSPQPSWLSAPLQAIQAHCSATASAPWES